jgi:cytochrome c
LTLNHNHGRIMDKTNKGGSMKVTRLLLGICGALAWSLAPAQSVDVSAAEALAKKSGCTKCHSVSAKKEGPSFKETAAKYKGKPDAEAALMKHLTTNPKIKVDGKEELHDSPKTKNEAEIKNLIQYILSR